MKKLPKKPKKPAQKASVNAWKKFDERYKNWEKKCASIKSEKGEKEKLIKKYASK